MNSSEPFLSIVITAYNLEKHIEASLISALHQSYTNIEIIIIDDGSTDNTAAIIKDYQQKDNRIKYFYQTNNGVAATRNFSLKVIQGIFFTFLDGDDLIADDFALKVSDNCKSTDLLIFDFIEEETPGSLKNKYFDMALLDSYKENYSDSSFLIADKYPSLWAKAYRTEFIKNNNIEFYNTKTLEDMFFILDILMCKPIVNYLPFLSYTYKYNAVSLSRKINISVINDRQKAVSFYLNKYSAIKIPEHNYFFTFWFNRVFMQLFLVFSSKLINIDRKNAFFQTIDFIHLTLYKMKKGQLVKSNVDLINQLSTMRLKFIFLIYWILYLSTGISKSFGYAVFYVFSFFFKIIINK